MSKEIPIMHKATKLIAICTAACGLSLFATGCETLGAKECENCVDGECTAEHAENAEQPSGEHPSNGEHPG